MTDLSFDTSPFDDQQEVPTRVETGCITRPRQPRADPLAVLREGLAHDTLQRLYRKRSGALAWSTALLRPLGRSAAPRLLPAPHGALLYQLVRLIDARLVVAIGTSHGIAATWLACALRENRRCSGDRCIIGLEPQLVEAQAARETLRSAAVSRYVDIREGALSEEIARIDTAVDLLYIDREAGGNAATDAPLALIRHLLPRLCSGSAIIVDRIRQWPQMAAWLRNPANGFTAMTLPYPAGVEVLVKR